MVNYHGIRIRKEYMYKGCGDVIIEYDWSWNPIETPEGEIWQNKGTQNLHIPTELWEEFKKLMKKEIR